MVRRGGQALPGAAQGVDFSAAQSSCDPAGLWSPSYGSATLAGWLSCSKVGDLILQR